MVLRIVSIYAASGGEEIGVTFESVSDDGQNSSKETLVISSKQYLCLGISKGECTTELYDEVAHASKVWGAVRRGISMLGYGACSGKALAAKLYVKGYSKDIAAEAVEQLVGMGLMRPYDDARHEAQRLVGKKWGKRRIVSELYAKGYSSEAVAFAVNALEDDGVDFVENCRELIKKRYGGMPQEPAEQRKAYAALARYGYSPSEIKEACRK